MARIKAGNKKNILEVLIDYLLYEFFNIKNKFLWNFKEMIFLNNKDKEKVIVIEDF